MSAAPNVLPMPAGNFDPRDSCAQVTAMADDFRNFLKSCMTTNEKPDPDAPLSVAEVAEFLKVSEDLVYRLVASGELRHFRMGDAKGIIRVRRVDVLEYQENAIRQQQETGGTASLFVKHTQRRRKKVAG